MFIGATRCSISTCKWLEYLWKIVWKTKITFLLIETLLFFLEQKYFILGDIIFKIPKNLITSAFFFAEADTKKHRYASGKASNAVLVKLADWIIKNDHVINCAMFFCKWFKHGQTSNVIWLSTTWLLIFRLEVANEKPASIWIEISC